MAIQPYSALIGAAGDLGLGAALASQTKETEEERKKRLLGLSNAAGAGLAASTLGLGSTAGGRGY
jgi:hypothetical protein